MQAPATAGAAPGLSRRRKTDGGGADQPEAKSFLQTLKDFDAYAKPLDDFRVRTSSGALVTIVSYILIGLLLISEFVDWQTVQVRPSLDVDRARKEKMWINLNITFPKIPCFLLSIDVMDVAGEHQNDVDHSIVKSRLDSMGVPIHVENAEIGGGADTKALAAAKDPNYCGSCYGASLPDGSKCCNTCEDVRRAYAQHSWSFTDPDGIEQCVREGYSQKLKEQQHEGCNMQGHIEVNKVAGNFHFAPGKSFQQSSMHVHDLHSYLSGTAYDFSHTIESLSFGQAVDFVNPLDGVVKTTPNGAYMYQYFIKVVSTKYKYRNGTVVHTNQIAVTEHSRDTKTNGQMGLPGVFFNFDISPMLVTYTEYKKPFSHFLTDVCAIVGGIFTVAGILDSIIYTAERTMQRKNELGKLK